MTRFALLQCLAILLASSHPAPDGLRVGREREGFGGSMTSGTHMGDLGGNMYFPKGRSDERFSIVGLRSIANPYDERIGLKYETKRHGVLKEEWTVPLLRFTSVEHSHFTDVKTHRTIPIPSELKSSGTLVKILLRVGYRLPPSMSPKTRSDLSPRRGYAGYGLVLADGFSLGCWYFDENANFREEKVITLDSSSGHGHASSGSFPKIGVPYPVTRAEMRGRR